MSEENKKQENGKNLGGRPYGSGKYKTPEEMIVKIDAYFAKAEDRVRSIVTKKGDVVQIGVPAPVHVTGLCEFLEISNQTLNNYQEREGFFEPITRAKLKCEAHAVDQLFEGQKGNKADFVLQHNFGWKNRSEVDTTNTTKIIYIDKDEKQAYEDHINKAIEE